MTRLFLFRGDPTERPAPLTDTAELTRVLADVGVEYQLWTLASHISAESADAAILEAYGEQVAALKERFGYQSVDVARLTPDSPNAAAARQKFLAEHVHADDEARFFVAGTGTFYLHFPARGLVAALQCTAGDWVRVPKGTRHWFDMGTAPRFAAIRLFTRPDGWVADFTGEPVAARYPTHDELAAR